MDSTPEIITIADLQNLIGELRMMARSLISTERNPLSLTPTALAMTALRRSKLGDQDWDDIRWENRAHFFSMLALTMRHALVDRARKAGAKGRSNIINVPGNDDLLVNFPEEIKERPAQFIALDEALARLEKVEPKLAELIKQSYYMGYTIKEVAVFSQECERTVKRKLKKAQTILGRMMKEHVPGSEL